MISFIKFVLVGISNTFLGLGTIYIAWSAFGLADISANIIGYAVGILWGFFLNSKWTFNSDRPVAQGILRYGLVCGVAYLGNLATLISVRSAIEGRSFVPHVSGLIIYTLISYLGSRYFAFSKVGRN